MKVKNIMFSGFMAVILMGVAGNASAAVQIASKAYVDGRVNIADTTTVADELEKKADKSEIGTLPSDADEGVDTVYGYITQKTSGIATDENLEALTGRVGTVEGKVTALEGKMTTAESDIDALESAMTGNGDGSVAKKISDALDGYATEDYVGTQIQSATANMATDTEVQSAINALSAEGGAIADLSGTVDGISGRVTELENADYQNASQVSGAITTAITGLNLANTYEAKGEAAKVQANVDTLSEKVAGKAATSDVTALAGRVTTAEGEIDTLQSDMTAAQGNITTLQGDVAKKVDQTAYDTKVNELNTAIAGNTTKIGENTAKIGQVEATANAAIPMPEGACATGANCVLSTVGGTIQWVNITEPLD